MMRALKPKRQTRKKDQVVQPSPDDELVKSFFEDPEAELDD